MAYIPNIREVSQQQFDDMLGALPPEKIACAGFLVGEPYDHDGHGRPRFDAYFEYANSYWSAGLMTVGDFMNPENYELIRLLILERITAKL